jgi:uncharacterized protein YsxB (DUF464 family)
LSSEGTSAVDLDYAAGHAEDGEKNSDALVPAASAGHFAPATNISRDDCKNHKESNASREKCQMVWTRRQLQHYP